MLLWLVPSIFVTRMKFPLRSCAVRGTSTRWTNGASVFHSQFCIPGGCAWVFCSPNACSFSRERILLPDLHSKKLCVSFPFLERMLLQSGTNSAPRSSFQEAVHELNACSFSQDQFPLSEPVREFSALRSCLGGPVPSWLSSPPRFIDTLPNLIDLFLLEGCSAGSITISYSTCIAFGAWLSFAGKVSQARRSGGDGRQRGAQGGGEREVLVRRCKSAESGAKSCAKSARASGGVRSCRRHRRVRHFASQFTLVSALNCAFVEGRACKSALSLYLVLF
jgi:hypothetical protein